jgi:hypothetical protein
MPNTTIVSHRPEIIYQNIVSCCPSMHLSTLSANAAKHTGALTGSVVTTVEAAGWSLGEGRRD